MPPTARGVRRLVLAAFAAILVASLAGIAPAAGSSGDEHVLPRDMRGEQAIQALGDRLNAVAAQNGMTAPEFRAALREDSMLWVDRTGQLLFVDEFTFGGDHDETHDHEEASGLDDSQLDGTTVPSATAIFELHSRPATETQPAPLRTILLDFTGHDATGTAWDGKGETAIAAPYSIDGDPTTFSEAERAEIYSVWKRVAEDYAPFDVDVTTEDPGHGPAPKGHELIRRDTTSDQQYGTRVVITPSKTYNCSCGGVAYVGVFNYVGSNHDKYQPAWVFTTGVGTGAKNIAEAASHEAGHNLGLSHDGTKTSGYYRGHGDWAPLMGVGYYEPISQWSRGEYSGANNKEDDLVEMQMLSSGVATGIPLAVDDITTAVDLGSATGTHIYSGLIGSAADKDHFAFGTTVGGTVSVSAKPASVSPNLDIQLQLVDSAGTVLATVDPPSDASDGNDTSLGLDAHLDTILPIGTYTVVIDGVGFGDPGTTGYSDYASLGRYTVSVTVTDDGATSGGEDGGTTEPPPTSAPSTPSGFDAVGNTDGTATLSWTDTPDEDGYHIQREFRHKNGSWRGTTTWTVTKDTTSTTDSPGSGTFRYRISAYNAAGSSAYTAWDTVSVSGGGGGGNPNKGGKAIAFF